MDRPEDLAEDADVAPAAQEGHDPASATEPEAQGAEAGDARGDVELDAEEAQLVDESAPRKRRLWPVLVVLAVLAAAGGAVFVVGGGAEQPAGPKAAAGSELRVVLDADGDGPRATQERTVRCPSKKHRAACRRIAKLPRSAFRPAKRKAACTTIYGGPDRVMIRGQWRGRTIAVDLSRTNGCEIARFEKWQDVLAKLYPRYRPGQTVG